jgi:hypothetical protein
MEKVGMFYGHLEYITDIGYILWPFGNLVAIWHILPRIGILCEEKSGNPAFGESQVSVSWYFSFFILLYISDASKGILFK